jgi:hypothetical protein
MANVAAWDSATMILQLQALDKCMQGLEEQVCHIKHNLLFFSTTERSTLIIVQIINIENGTLDEVLDSVVNYHVPSEYLELCASCQFPQKPLLEKIPVISLAQVALAYILTI